MADETSVERINRVAQQIVADATSGPIASAPSPAEVAALLRKVEWATTYDGEEACPRCDATKREGHDEDCELAAMLRRCAGMEELEAKAKGGSRV